MKYFSIKTETGDSLYNFLSRRLKIELMDGKVSLYIDGEFCFDFDVKYWNLFKIIISNRKIKHWQSGELCFPFNTIQVQSAFLKVNSTALYQLILATVETTGLLNLVNGTEEEFNIYYNYIMNKFIGLGGNGLYYFNYIQDDLYSKELVSKNQLCKMDIVCENIDKELFYIPYATPRKTFKLSEKADSLLNDIQDKYNETRKNWD